MRFLQNRIRVTRSCESAQAPDIEAVQDKAQNDYNVTSSKNKVAQLGRENFLNSSSLSLRRVVLEVYFCISLCQRLDRLSILEVRFEFWISFFDMFVNRTLSPPVH
jgi:hypothetical protein